MIKTTEQILDMCEEWNNELEIKRQGSNIVLDDPRPLFYKKWVDYNKLLSNIEDLEGIIQGGMSVNALKKLLGVDVK